MLYYGDRSRRVAPAVAVAELATRWSDLARSVAPSVGEVESALVEAGGVAQGLADAAFEAAGGVDGPDAAADAAMHVCLALGGALVAALGGNAPDGRGVSSALRALAAAPVPAAVVIRVPEGYAHYAVYPQAYVAAARSAAAAAPAAGPSRRWTVIGIRSIGTSLAAAVAAALGAATVATVRPHGHPHDRRVAISPALLARLLRDADASFAVVDEGPGLSGSSFAAVSRELERAGVSRSRIHLFPSHRGEPGPAASGESRERWASTARRVVTLDELGGPRGAPVREWIAGLVPSAAHASVEDLSGGAWRPRAFAASRSGAATDRDPPDPRWPAVFAQQERRKFLVRGGDADAWLAEFAGLGSTGEARLKRARALAEAGAAPPVAGLRRGFLVRRWVEGVPLDRAALASRDVRRELFAAVARYLGLRAAAFTGADCDGASREVLARTLELNAAEALGEGGREAARELVARTGAPPGRRTAVDGKLEPWEWVRSADGRLWKTDGFQHADGHDLVGAQPLAWDVAGAIVELAPSSDEAAELAAGIERATGVTVPPDELAFHRAAYAALRVARWSFALASEGDAFERMRIERERARCMAALAEALGAPVTGAAAAPAG